MSLTNSRIKKIFQADFKGTNPVIIASNKAANDLFREIIDALKNKHGVQSCHIEKYNNNKTCQLEISLPSDRYLRVHFRIKVSEKHELIISHYGIESLIYDIKQLHSFTESVVNELQKAEFEKRKSTNY